MISITPLARHTARRLRRAPAFATAAVLTLTLGIGAATAVFSLVEHVLLAPLPYPRGDRLVDLSHEITLASTTPIEQSDATFLYYRQHSHALSAVAVYRADAAQLGPRVGPGLGLGLGAARAGATPPEHVAAARVSASLFRVLETAPLRGRGFRDDEDLPAAPPVVILSEGLWRRRFGGDPGLVGARVDVDGAPREVVGIMPASFAFPSAATQLWLPIGIDPARTKSAAFDYSGIGRLRDGVTIAAATTELDELLPRVPQAYPGRLTADGIRLTHMRAIVRPMRDVVVGRVAPVLWTIAGAVLLVLLIACANVANLFLVRLEGRRHELAVRRALGASRAELALELLAEGAVVAALGAALGVPLAMLSLRVLRALPAGVDLPRITEVHADAATIGIGIALAIGTVALVAVVPSLQSSGVSGAAALADVGRTSTAGRLRHRARHLLVGLQVALALVLLAGAGLMARSFARLRAVPTGIDASGTLSVRVTLANADYRSDGDVVHALNGTVNDLRAVPGVRSAGVVTKLPLVDAQRRDTALFIQDPPTPPGTIPNIHQVSYASAGYFDAMGIPILAGRAFDAPDPTRAPRDVIVSHALARRYWADGRAVGQHVRFGAAEPWYTVIGVAGDVHGTSLEAPPDEMIYLPLVTAPRGVDSARWSPRDVAVVVRAKAALAPVEARALDVVRRDLPATAPYAIQPMRDIVRAASSRTSYTLLLLGIASAIALVLGAIGIYGVVSYVVSLRTREIAVRLALGADPGGVRALVVRQALIVVATGSAAGLVASLAFARVIGGLLFGVAPDDAATLVASAALLLVVGALASWLPALRASRVDPAVALRAE